MRSNNYSDLGRRESSNLWTVPWIPSPIPLSRHHLCSPVLYMFRPTSLFVVPFLACPSFIVSFPSWLRLVLRLSSIRRPVPQWPYRLLFVVFSSSHVTDPSFRKQAHPHINHDSWGWEPLVLAAGVPTFRLRLAALTKPLTVLMERSKFSAALFPLRFRCR